MVQAVAEGLHADGVNGFAYEGKHQHHACFGFADSALAHVEEGCLIELTYRSTVAALYVIGVDLQLWTGIGVGLGGGAEVAASLLGEGLLCTGLYLNQTAEYARCLIVEDILHQFLACAAWGVMQDGGVVVHMLLSIGHGHST